MFCDKCGAKNRDGATFCSNCGERLSVEGPVSSSQTINGSLSAENPSEPANKKQYVKRDQSPIESIKKVIAECIPSIKSINAVEKKSLHTGTFYFLVCAVLLALQIIVSGVVVFINSRFVSQQMDYFDLCLARTYSNRLWIYALDMFFILSVMIMTFLLYRSRSLHIPRTAVIIPAVLCSMQIIIRSVYLIYYTVKPVWYFLISALAILSQAWIIYIYAVMLNKKNKLPGGIFLLLSLIKSILQFKYSLNKTVSSFNIVMLLLQILMIPALLWMFILSVRIDLPRNGEEVCTDNKSFVVPTALAAVLLIMLTSYFSQKLTLDNFSFIKSSTTYDQVMSKLERYIIDMNKDNSADNHYVLLNNGHTVLIDKDNMIRESKYENGAFYIRELYLFNQGDWDAGRFTDWSLYLDNNKNTDTKPRNLILRSNPIGFDRNSKDPAFNLSYLQYNKAIVRCLTPAMKLSNGSDSFVDKWNSFAYQQNLCDNIKLYILYQAGSNSVTYVQLEASDISEQDYSTLMDAASLAVFGVDQSTSLSDIRTKLFSTGVFPNISAASANSTSLIKYKGSYQGAYHNLVLTIQTNNNASVYTENKGNIKTNLLYITIGANTNSYTK